MTQTIRITLIGFIAAFVFASSAAVAGPAEDTNAAFKAQEAGDYETAISLYQRAAKGGNEYAMFNMGTMYYTGQGVKRSWVEAMKWYRQAAAKGLPDAENAVGDMYQLGESVRPNPAQAVKWFLLAAGQGHPPAQSSLGIIYSTGAKGVPVDVVQAHLWFNIAGKEDKMAAGRRDRVAAKMTAAQIAEAEKLFAAWKPKK